MWSSDWCGKIKELNFELKSGIWWNYISCTCLAIGIFWRACQLCHLSLLQLANSLIPCSDNLTNTHLEFERFILLNWRVENGTIHQGSMVMTCYKSTFRTNWPSTFIKFFNDKFSLHICILIRVVFFRNLNIIINNKCKLKSNCFIIYKKLSIF